MTVPGGGSDDPLREFAEEIVDDLRIAETIRKRDSADTGKRMTVEELAESVGIDLETDRG